MHQIRHVLRRLAHAPTFTIITLATLGIGIGANTAIFSVINGILLKPLPYPEAERLVGVWLTAPGIGIKDLNMSPSLYFTCRDESRTFEDIGLWRLGGVSVTGVAEPEEVQSMSVTDGLLPVLGIRPALGRWFSRKDDSPGNPGTVMLAYEYWRQKFGGQPSILGRRLMIDGQAREVIGVMPQSFRFLNFKPVLFLPFQIDRNKTFLGQFNYQGIARLKPGITLAQANADVARMLPIANRKFPAPPGYTEKMFEEARIAPSVRPLKRDATGDVGNVLWILMGTLGAVLLIACANVANLLLVRADGRRQEFAIRAALGAGWTRIARELTFESLLLGVLGGAVGLGVAYAAIRLLVAIGPATLPRLTEISIDPLVLLFALAISLLSGLLFGLIPVFRYAGPRIETALRSGGRALSQSRERHRARNALVVIQVALAVILLIGSGLMIRTFQAMRKVQPGFTHPEEIQTFRIAIPEAHMKDPERVARLENEILRTISEIPQVSSASLVNNMPMSGNRWQDLLFAEGRDYSVHQLPPIRRFNFIAPGFFKTMGTPLLAGRDITWTDIYNRRPVALVSENLARELWRGPNTALGKRVRESLKSPWREVIGVVADVRDDGVNKTPPTAVYWPILTNDFEGFPTQVIRSVSFAVRSRRTGSDSFIKQIRQAVWEADPALPLALIGTQADLYNKSMARTSFTLVMLAIAGAMALLLGIVGIYGVISYSVSQRTREIGIRMALGAEPRGLERMFVRDALLLAGIGAACGLVAALGLTRLMSSLLYAVSPTDPLTYGAVSVALLAAAAAASYLPARRVAAIDPSEALRAE